MLNGISFKTKLTINLLIPLIVLLVIAFIANNNLTTITEELIYTLHEESFTGMNLVLSAERDMYRALLAKKTFISMDPQNPGFEMQVQEFKRYVQQTKDGIMQAMAILEREKEKWTDFKKNAGNVFDNYYIFNTSFGNWASATEYAVEKMKNGESIEYNQTSDVSFDMAREGIYAIAELLKAISEESISEKRQEKESLAKGILSTTGITAIIVLILGIMVVRSVVKPVQQLSLQAEKFGKGDLTVNFEIKGRDEIARMAATLNDMAVNLRKAIGDILTTSQKVFNSATDLAAIAEEQSALAEQLSAQAEDINRNAANVSATIQEVGASVQEVSATAQTSSKSMAELSGLAQDAGKEAVEGEKAIEQVKTAMTVVNKEIRNTADIVKELASNALSIEEIVNLISAIAGQTNLLALNAAIEAARAGEAGRGFAVVAEEIRKLAEDSESATQRINHILKEIQQGSQNADKATLQVVQQVNKITDEIEKASEQFSVIAARINGVLSSSQELVAGSEEQSAAAEEMAAAMESASGSVVDVVKRVQEMAAGIEQQSKGAQQVSIASETLSSLAREQEETVMVFKIEEKHEENIDASKEEIEPESIGE